MAKKTKREYTRKSVKEPKKIDLRLDTLVIDQNSEKPKAEKKDLGIVTTDDLKRPPKTKIPKPHDFSEDVMITTGDFKPRKYKDMRKL